MTRNLKPPLLIASGLLVAAWAVSSPPSPRARNNVMNDAPVRRVAEVSSCQSEWSRCRDNADLVENYSGMANVRAECRTRADEKAQYGTPEWPWVKFGKYRAGDDYPKTGMIVIGEADARFQNGFGAMAHVAVSCLYDLRSSKVVDVEIEEGQ